MIPDRLDRILRHALDGQAPTRDDSLYLLGLPEASMEAAVLRSVADRVSRRRSGNQGILQAQIGLEVAPCPGACGFCVFGEGHSTAGTYRLTDAEVLEQARAATADGDLRVLFLMTMHTFDMEHFLALSAQIRATIPAHTQIIANVGDFDRAQARRMRAVGIAGAYHVCRLGEGRDNRLDPVVRKRTLKAVRDEGLDLYFCVEPIGPEHSDADLIEQMQIGFDHGCFQHAAMRRVAVPGTPLAHRGQVTELRQAQVVALVTLASLACPQTKCIGVHEPNLLGLTAGANAISAESGANPRDTAKDTQGSRGKNAGSGRNMLWEAGFTALQRGDGSAVPLALHVPQAAAMACSHPTA